MRIVRITLRAASSRTSGLGLVSPPFLNTGFPCRLQVTIITGSSAASSFSFSVAQGLRGGAGRVEVVLEVRAGPTRRGRRRAPR